jgi:hypothetical protein
VGKKGSPRRLGMILYYWQIPQKAVRRTQGLLGRGKDEAKP